MIKKRLSQVSLCLLTSLFLATSIVPSSAVFADPTTVTDRDTICADASDPYCDPNEVYVEVARTSSTGSQLEAPVSFIRLSFASPPTGSNHSFRIQWCATGSTRWCDPSIHRSIINIVARPYIMSGSSEVIHPTSQRSYPQPLSTATHNLPAGAQRSAINGRYNYLLEVQHTRVNPSTEFEAIVPFRITAVGSSSADDPRAGYSKSNPLGSGVNYPFAIQNRGNITRSPTPRNDLRVSFRIPCFEPDGTRVGSSFRMSWFDADATSASQPPNVGISWQLRLIRDGTTIRTLTSQQASGFTDTSDWRYQDFMGGQGEARGYTINQSSFPYQTGDELEWRWNGVLMNNGVQLNMPFDDASLFDDCSEVDFNYVSSFNDTLSGGYPYPSGGIVSPGSNYSVAVQAENISPVNGSGISRLVVRNLNENLTTPVTTTGQYFPQISPAGLRATAFGVHNIYAYQDDTRNLNAGVNGNCSEDGVDRNDGCWLWLFQNLSSFSTASAGFSFRVNPSAPLGSDICFDIHVRPSSSFGGVHSPEPLCFRVSEPSKPTVQIQEGDTRVGSVISLSNNSTCSLDSSDPRATGNINTNTSGSFGSGGEYAVVAVGSINGFRSNIKLPREPATNDESLKFNNDGPSAGGYGVFCRRDFTNITSDADFTFPSGFVLDQGVIDGLPNDRRLVVRINGNMTIPTGTLTIRERKNVTFVVTGGVTVLGNIQYAPSYANRSTIPSFAIHTQNDINILSLVSRMDGLYTTNRRFSTCGAYNEPIRTTGFGNCANKLTVNGIVIANEVILRRLTGNITNTPAEVFRFLPELYLNSPPDSRYEVNLVKENYLDLPPVF